jgi:hypothetical protein
MQTTLNLLDAALATGKTVADWTRDLKLSANALYTARIRGHLSPAIAGALAEELGEDVRDWMCIAALESEKESACKSRMLRRFTRSSKTV